MTLAADAPRRAGVRSAARRAALAAALERAAFPLLLLLVALCVYRPWIPAPFSTLDFGEFIPLLRGRGPVDGFLEMVRYFAGHGRSTWLTYAFISLNWELFGGWAQGWDLLRFALVTGVVWLAYVFFLRLGCSRAGAAAGAALLVVATPAQEAWTRMTGEPLGLAALLGASLLALGYRQSRRWLARAAAIALLIAAAVMFKEVLAVCALPVVVLGACWRPGRGLQRPRADRRTVVLVLLATLAVAGTAVIVLATLAGVPRNGYAHSYGHAALSGFRFQLNLRMMSMPLSRTHPTDSRMVIALLAGVASVGWAVLLHNPRTRDARLLTLMLLALVPVLGAAVFLPWPLMERYYAFPFFAGSAAVLAVAVTALLRKARPFWVLAPVALAIAVTAVDAAVHADRSRATRLVNGDVARELARVPAGDTVFVAVGYMEGNAWAGLGATMERYLTAIERVPANASPVFLDVLCKRAAERLKRDPAGIRVMAYGLPCQDLPAPQRTFARPYGDAEVFALYYGRRSVDINTWIPETAVPPAGR